MAETPDRPRPLGVEAERPPAVRVFGAPAGRSSIYHHAITPDGKVYVYYPKDAFNQFGKWVESNIDHVGKDKPELPPSEAAQFVAEHPLPVITKHVCGESGYDGMKDPPCSGCEARDAHLKLTVPDNDAPGKSEHSIPEPSDLFRLVASRINSQMIVRKISRADLASKMGVTRSYITQLLDGTANMTLEKMESIADAVGLRVVDLVTPPYLPPSTPSKEQACSPSATSSSSSASQSLPVPSPASGSTDDAWAMEEARAIFLKIGWLPEKHEAVLYYLAATLGKARMGGLSDGYRINSATPWSDAAIYRKDWKTALAKVGELEQKISDAVYSRHGANGMCCQLRENAEAKLNELTAQISCDADLHKATLKRNEELEKQVESWKDAFYREERRAVEYHNSDQIEGDFQCGHPVSCIRNSGGGMAKSTTGNARCIMCELKAERDQRAAENAVLRDNVEMCTETCGFEGNSDKKTHQLGCPFGKDLSPLVATMLKDHEALESLRKICRFWAMFRGGTTGTCLQAAFDHDGHDPADAILNISKQ